ncbi:unnamed protein product [Cercopithifilaria johnstoni]|uniref:Uncharacterized protein n=1 Tax=Cercopithifilaria johnstoni TaxID=2874296 RepID=A0A8J2QAE5_9BILA|nr:unnamed protein product [Cercopithifilaria johnstoni]
MAEGNMFKNITDSAGLNAKNMQNVAEIGNDLIDKLSEKVEEGGEKINELRNEMSKIASDIITPTEKLGQKIENETSEILKEAKGKLDDTVNNVGGAVSGVINDLTTFSNKIQEKAPEYLGDIKDGMETIADDIHKTISEKVDGLEELKKGEMKNESNNEAVENVDGVVSGFKELCKGSVGDRLQEGMDKIYQCAENVNEAVSVEGVDKIKKFASDISEKGAMKIEEGADKINEVIKETFEPFQKLNEEVNKKITDVKEIGGEKLHSFKGEIDKKANEINAKVENIKNDVFYGSNDGDKKIAGMSDISVKADNGDVKRDKFSVENPIVTADNDGFRSAENIDHLQSNVFNNDTVKVEGNASELMQKLEHDKEMQAIKKIVPPGENIPEQVGTLSESGVYYDDYEVEKLEGTATRTLSDIVNDEVDEMDKLLDKAFNNGKKLNRPETTDDVINQEDNRQVKGMEKPDANVNIIGEGVQKGYSNTYQGIKKEEVDDNTAGLNDNNMASDDNKTKMQFTGDEERKLANTSPQFSSISHQTKLILNSVDEAKFRYPDMIKSLIIASEHIEKLLNEDSSEAASESCFVTKKSFTTDGRETHEMKSVSDPSQLGEQVASLTFTNEDVMDKAAYEMPDPPRNNITSSFQPLTSENISNFSTVPNVPENALQSTIINISDNDQNKTVIKILEVNQTQEKTEPEHQSSKIEKSVSHNDPFNRAPPPSPSPESSFSLRSPKNVPPPVPPKKKSIEMILSEEAKAMGQRSLRGIETLAHGIINPEIEKDELKSKYKTKENVETSATIEKQVEKANNENESKHEAIQKSESEKAHETPLNQKSEAQKTKSHPTLPATEVKPEAVSEKNKTDRMKSKSGDGQQQQSRRCTIL